MSNEFYTVTGSPSTGSTGSSIIVRQEFALIAAAFDKLPALAGNGDYLLKVNAGGTRIDAIAASGILTLIGGQPLDSDLTAIAALSSAADKIAYATGSHTWALTDFTAAGRTIVGQASVAAVLAAIGGAASGDNTDITSLDSPALGAATATTQSAGDSTTKVATTAFVTTAITAAVVDSAIASARNARASITAASATATFTADEVIAETALAGVSKKFASINQAVDLSTTGANGMDTGLAPASGYVAVYFIGKADGTKALLACAVATSSGEVYGGANMPSGYTLSALLGICPTNGSRQFLPGLLLGRRFMHQAFVVIFTAHAAITTLTSQSISGAVPPSAKTASLFMGNTTASGGRHAIGAAADATGTGGRAQTTGIGSVAHAIGGTSTVYDGGSLDDIPIITAQTVFIYINTGSALGSTNNMYVSDYTF